MDKSSSPKKKLASSVNGNTSSIIATKGPLSKEKSSAKSKAASWSILAWKPSCQVLKLTTNELKISTILLGKLTNLRFSKSTSIAKTSSYLAGKFWKKNESLAKPSFSKISKKGLFDTELSKISQTSAY